MKNFFRLLSSVLFIGLLFSCASVKAFVPNTACNVRENVKIESGWLGRFDYSWKNYKLVNKPDFKESDQSGLLILGFGATSKKDVTAGNLLKSDRTIYETAFVQTTDVTQTNILLKIEDKTVQNYILVDDYAPIKIEEINNYEKDIFFDGFIEEENMYLQIEPVSFYQNQDNGKVTNYMNLTGAHIFVNNKELAVLDFFSGKRAIDLNETYFYQLSESNQDYCAALFLNLFTFYSKTHDIENSSGTMLSEQEKNPELIDIIW